jgi:hypothetical protein
MKKGESKNLFNYKEKDIAKVAGISMGAYRVAKTRGKINPANLRSVAGFIFTRWVARLTQEPERCEHRHTKKDHPACFPKEE